MNYWNETPGQIAEIYGRLLISSIPVGVRQHPVAGYIAMYEIPTLQETPSSISSRGDSPEEACQDLGEALVEQAEKLKAAHEARALTDEDIKRLHLERILQTT